MRTGSHEDSGQEAGNTHSVPSSPPTYTQLTLRSREHRPHRRRPRPSVSNDPLHDGAAGFLTGQVEREEPSPGGDVGGAPEQRGTAGRPRGGGGPQGFASGRAHRREGVHAAARRRRGDDHQAAADRGGSGRRPAGDVGGPDRCADAIVGPAPGWEGVQPIRRHVDEVVVDRRLGYGAITGLPDPLGFARATSRILSGTRTPGRSTNRRTRGRRTPPAPRAGRRATSPARSARRVAGVPRRAVAVAIDVGVALDVGVRPAHGASSRHHACRRCWRRARHHRPRARRSRPIRDRSTQSVLELVHVVGLGSMDRPSATQRSGSLPPTVARHAIAITEAMPSAQDRAPVRVQQASEPGCGGPDAERRGRWEVGRWVETRSQWCRIGGCGVPSASRRRSCQTRRG